MKERLPRPCRLCGKKFIPTGKYCKLCDDCRSLHWAKRKNIKRSSPLKTKDGV